MLFGKVDVERCGPHVGPPLWSGLGQVSTHIAHCVQRPRVNRRLETLSDDLGYDDLGYFGGFSGFGFCARPGGALPHSAGPSGSAEEPEELSG